MLSVIILCGGGAAGWAAGHRPETIVRTLAPLVQASVKGLVRDVVLAGPRGLELALIAEHAGCAFIEAGQEAEALSQALSIARAEDLMIFMPAMFRRRGFSTRSRIFWRWARRRSAAAICYARRPRVSSSGCFRGLRRRLASSRRGACARRRKSSPSETFGASRGCERSCAGGCGGSLSDRAMRGAKSYFAA